MLWPGLMDHRHAWSFPCHFKPHSFGLFKSNARPFICSYESMRAFSGNYFEASKVSSGCQVAIAL